jgi:two-component system, NarL family, nitrate/nitrite response regulator NarL
VQEHQTNINQKPLGVLIVDDHQLMIDTLVSALGSETNFEVDGVSNVNAALSQILERGKYDVVLLDYQLPGSAGLDSLRQLIKANGGSVALFSGVASWPVVQNAVDQGACGFLPKTTPMKTLVHAIRFIADGEVYLPYEYMKRLSNEDVDELGLKPRERQVLAYLCEGMQNKEIGREVGIEEVIVKMDVKSICRKLEVRNRTEAVLEARKRGIV